jgi:putative two-component system response regulator
LNQTPVPRVLIVDDTPENVALLSSVLTGYRLSVALNGLEALRVAGDVRPDLIMLDVMMPGIDGFEVCRRLKADAGTADIPVIFLTAQDDEPAEAEGFRAGAVDYVTRPFRPSVVCARVATHLALLSARRELASQNGILEEKVANRTIQLHEAVVRLRERSLETILRLARAAEFKDDDTGSHLLRMSDYAAIVARQLGLTPDEVDVILHAAPMHDIGKIGIPDQILCKPGKLDPEERAMMMRHCEIGAKILSGSDSEMIQTAETIAWTHHERWDGKGYPRNLEGEDIPLVGRIAAIADVFDALTTKRPYKEAFPVDRAFTILREERGRQFDPRVVDAFFVQEEEILAVRARLGAFQG